MLTAIKNVEIKLMSKSKSNMLMTLLPDQRNLNIPGNSTSKLFLKKLAYYFLNEKFSLKTVQTSFLRNHLEVIFPGTLRFLWRDCLIIKHNATELLIFFLNFECVSFIPIKKYIKIFSNSKAGKTHRLFKHLNHL